MVESGEASHRNDTELGPGKGLDDGQLGQGPSMLSGTEWEECISCTEDKMVGWHHGLDGHGFEQAPGQGSLGTQRVGHN